MISSASAWRSAGPGGASAGGVGRTGQDVPDGAGSGSASSSVASGSSCGASSTVGTDGSGSCAGTDRSIWGAVSWAAGDCGARCWRALVMALSSSPTTSPRAEIWGSTLRMPATARLASSSTDSSVVSAASRSLPKLETLRSFASWAMSYLLARHVPSQHCPGSAFPALDYRRSLGGRAIGEPPAFVATEGRLNAAPPPSRPTSPTLLP